MIWSGALRCLAIKLWTPLRFFAFFSGWCVKVISGCVRTLVSSKCTGLRRLILTSHRQTSDSDIEAIFPLGRTLEQFSCMGSRNVSPESILDLAMHCPNLIYLDVSYCDQIEAAGHGVHDQLRKLLPKCNVQISINDVWTKNPLRIKITKVIQQSVQNKFRISLQFNDFFFV